MGIFFGPGRRVCLVGCVGKAVSVSHSLLSALRVNEMGVWLDALEPRQESRQEPPFIPSAGRSF